MRFFDNRMVYKKHGMKKKYTAGEATAYISRKNARKKLQVFLCLVVFSNLMCSFRSQTSEDCVSWRESTQENQRAERRQERVPPVIGLTTTPKTSSFFSMRQELNIFPKLNGIFSRSSKDSERTKSSWKSWKRRKADGTGRRLTKCETRDLCIIWTILFWSGIRHSTMLSGIWTMRWRWYLCLLAFQRARLFMPVIFNFRETFSTEL